MLTLTDYETSQKVFVRPSAIAAIRAYNEGSALIIAGYFVYVKESPNQILSWIVQNA